MVIQKLKLLFLYLAQGSNLRNLIQFSHSKNSPIKIEFVVSSNHKAKGLLFAKKYKIKSKSFNFKNKEKDEKIILRYLKKIILI